MADDSGEAPKLIIDSDWKNEAQAEREKLAQAEKASSDAGSDGGQGEMPEADFRGLMGMLATQALMYMGGIADPNTGKPVFDPMYAQHMIDLLGVLEEKTKGNLTDEEAGEISGVLNELRSRFVELMQIVAKQQAGAGQGGPSGPTGPMPPQQ
ncbi:MAG: DUF1844 domain-containing protein [bacterium]|nr:DUF1844 domain-containing protein [bacterium]